MISKHPEHELSLSQLLDALEGMMDRIAGTNRCGELPSKHQLFNPDRLIVNFCLAVRRMLQFTNRFEQLRGDRVQIFDSGLT